MGRMIDADALLEKLGMLGVSNAYDRPSFWYGKDKKDYKVIPTKYHNGYDNALADVEKAIQELPTIEERKKGKWEFVSYGDGLGNYHCSECRAIASSYFVGNLVNRHWEYKLTKYCPNCGARMEGAEE